MVARVVRLGHAMYISSQVESMPDQTDGPHSWSKGCNVLVKIRLKHPEIGQGIALLLSEIVGPGCSTGTGDVQMGEGSRIRISSDSTRTGCCSLFCKKSSSVAAVTSSSQYIFHSLLFTSLEAVPIIRRLASSSERCTFFTSGRFSIADKVIMCRRDSEVPSLAQARTVLFGEVALLITATTTASF